MMKKFPPKQKIFEAYTAIADSHVDLGTEQAKVVSSNAAKTYTVTFKNNVYTSNDNATYWQGYAGYPILAVLLLQGRLPLDQKLAKQFAGIDWNAANKKYKRNYPKAAAAMMAEKGIDASQASAAMEKAYQDLKSLDITIKRGSFRPPKAAV